MQDPDSDKAAVSLGAKASTTSWVCESAWCDAAADAVVVLPSILVAVS
jgi:hypothetical protein